MKKQLLVKLILIQLIILVCLSLGYRNSYVNEGVGGVSSQNN